MFQEHRYKSCYWNFRAHSVKATTTVPGTNPSTVCLAVDLPNVTLATRPGSVPSRGLYHIVSQEIPVTYTLKNFKLLERPWMFATTLVAQQLFPLCPSHAGKETGQLAQCPEPRPFTCRSSSLSSSPAYPAQMLTQLTATAADAHPTYSHCCLRAG